jgi:hypothetical protein
VRTGRFGVAGALRWKPAHPLRAAFAISLFGAPLTLLLHAALWLILLTALIEGITGTFFNSVWFTVMQQAVPTEEISRVTSCYAVGSYALQPVGRTDPRGDRSLDHPVRHRRHLPAHHGRGNCRASIRYANSLRTAVVSSSMPKLSSKTTPNGRTRSMSLAAKLRGRPVWSKVIPLEVRIRRPRTLEQAPYLDRAQYHQRSSFAPIRPYAASPSLLFGDFEPIAETGSSWLSQALFGTSAVILGSSRPLPYQQRLTHIPKRSQNAPA